MALQTAYQILVSSDPDLLNPDQADVWNSGKVDSDEMVIVYAGPPLKSRTIYYWQVRIWDQDNNPTAYSEIASWETGLSIDSDWPAKWIGAAIYPDGSVIEKTSYSPLVRKEFEVTASPIKRARLYLCGIGQHECYLNGERVSDEVFNPQVTNFNHKVFYNTHDIKEHLHAGKNALGVWLNSGYYTPWCKYENRQGPILKAQIYIEYEEGSIVQFHSDESWRTAPSPISGVYYKRMGCFGGERFDADQEQAGWHTPGFDDGHWPFAVEKSPPQGRLEAQTIEPNRYLEKVSPTEITYPKADTALCDFGRVITGTIKITFKRDAKMFNNPSSIRIRYYEHRVDDRLDNKYHCFQEDFYFAKAVHHLTEDLIEWQPRFQYRVFRYAEIQWNIPAQMGTLEDVTAFETRNSMSVAGAFQCSDPTLNRIQQVAMATYESLLQQGVPADCSHREKAGWGAEAEASSDHALYHLDMARFYQKWLDDWNGNELPVPGGVSSVTPMHHKLFFVGGHYYANCFIPITYHTYLHYGQKRLLEQMFPLAQRRVEFLTERIEDGLLKLFTFDGVSEPQGKMQYLGDWNSPKRKTDDFFLNQQFNTLHSIRCIDLFISWCSQLGKDEIADHYRQMLQKIKQRFNERFFDPETGRYCGGRQPYQVLALYSGMPENDAMHASAVDALLEEIIVNKQGHVDTGVIATTYLFKVLMREELAELAYRLLMHPEPPSFRYFIDQGYTTFPESWFPGGSVCHSSFSGVGVWFFEALAGILPNESEPGFRQAIIRPQVINALDYAEGSYQSACGLIVSRWWRQQDRVTYKINLPPNTQGVIQLPESKAGYLYQSAAGEIKTASSVGKSKNRLEYRLKPGVSTFWLEQ